MDAIRPAAHSSGPPDSGGRNTGGGLEAWGWLCITRLAGGALILLVLLPLAALLLTTNFTDFMAGLRHPLVAPALRLSLTTTAIALAINVGAGTPLAWELAHRKSKRARWLELALQLPIVTPPAVAGVGLLLAFGRHGIIGKYLAEWGISIAFSSSAVVLAQVFVSAPLYLQAAVVAFRRVDENMLMVGRTLGGSPLRLFFRIAVPGAGSGLVAAMAISWARALGEFGATLMFAGNLSGRTQTLPLVIYEAMEVDFRAAQALAVVLIAVALVVLWIAPRAR
jgi:molybdate transport system permease protein